MPKCEENGCGKTASFNIPPYTKGRFCVSHKHENMTNVIDKLCEACNKSRAIFNYTGTSGGRFCVIHKLDEMVNIKGKRCAYKNGKDICYTAPIYNFDGEQKGKYCIIHKDDSMINVTGKRCEEETIKCNCIAQFNFQGKPSGKYCSHHKKEGMVDIKHKKCKFENCKLQPTYKYETDTSPKYCSIHRLEGMINGKHKLCGFDNCKKLPGYNFIGLPPLYCSSHKLCNMIDVKHPLCKFENCDLRPNYNFEKNKKPIYCVTHKSVGMIDVVSHVCISSFCSNYSSNNCEKYCLFCYIHLFPDKPIVRNHKTKEKAVVDFVLEHFSNYSWTADKRIQDGCSKRRPDLILDMGTHLVILEIDENQHNNYDCSCENKRLMEISQDLGHRNIVFIRFNPDDYYNRLSKKIASCWSINNITKILRVPSKHELEWSTRLDVLKTQIQYWIDNPCSKMIEVIQLFYDEN